MGENAKGKTTLLEALYLLMAGRSFRTPQMNDLMREGSSFFHIETYFEKWGIPQALKMTLQGQERRIQYNSSTLGSLSSLLGILQGVLMAPHDIELIKGAPSVRRHYLDFQIAQVDPLYMHHLTRYSKGIKQRNAQIRMRNVKSIEIFEEVIAQSANYIISQRTTAVSEINSLLNDYYHKITGKNERICLRYHSSLGSANVQKILEKLHSTRARELDLGFTLVGTHRDDLLTLITDKPAKIFASEGEMRSLVAALKLAEWERMRLTTRELPLLLVDDMGISLDPIRLKGLWQTFSKMGQVIITSANYFSFSNNSDFNIISY